MIQNREKTEIFTFEKLKLENICLINGLRVRHLNVKLTKLKEEVDTVQPSCEQMLPTKTPPIWKASALMSAGFYGADLQTSQVDAAEATAT